jgi:hypothetical protein
VNLDRFTGPDLAPETFGPVTFRLDGVSGPAFGFVSWGSVPGVRANEGVKVDAAVPVWEAEMTGEEVLVKV